MKFDLRDGTIPLLTTKKMFTRGIIHEILWYLQGSDNIKYLQDNNVHVCDAWANESGNLQKVYGYQWRKWERIYRDGRIEYIDQIAQLIDRLKNEPNDRRLIVSAWNVADVPFMGLPPCHYAFQCYCKPLSEKDRILILSKTHNINDLFDVYLEDCDSQPSNISKMLKAYNIPECELSMKLHQRSCDVGLGVPFNIVQYSILLRMLAEVVNMVPGDFIWDGGDVHIYTNHIDTLKKQLNHLTAQIERLHYRLRCPQLNQRQWSSTWLILLAFEQPIMQPFNLSS